LFLGVLEDGYLFGYFARGKVFSYCFYELLFLYDSNISPKILIKERENGD